MTCKRSTPRTHIVEAVQPLLHLQPVGFRGSRVRRVQVQLDEHLDEPVELALNDRIVRFIAKSTKSEGVETRRLGTGGGDAHPGDLQILPPSLHPRAVCRRTQLAPRRLLPLLARVRACAPDAPAAVGYCVGAEALRHEGRMAEQHREVIAVSQVLEGLCGVLDSQLGDQRLCQDVFVDRLV